MLTHPETDTDLDRVHAVQLAGAYSPSAREAENYNGQNLKATTRAKGKHLLAGMHRILSAAPDLHHADT